MSKEELVKTLDYILNRSDEQDIEVIAAAVIRRRRDIAYSIKMPMAPDPRRMAEEINSQFNIEGNIENMKNMVRDYALRIVKQEAPELKDEQLEELISSWLPSASDNKTKKKTSGRKKSSGKGSQDQDSSIPKDMLASMVEQFISFSQGQMSKSEDASLRKEIGAWPEKYWNAFPSVIRLLITDYLKEDISQEDFYTRLDLCLKMR